MYAPKLHSGIVVRFRLGSVVCPDQQQVLHNLSGLVELTGNVVLVSDYGRKKDHFAIIDVEGVSVPLIVRVAELSVIADAPKEADAESVISPALRQA